MASFRNVVKYTALTEYGLFGGLLAVAAVKGFVQALWNGHTFVESLIQGAMLHIWLPCILVCVHLVFVVTFPAIFRLLSTMAIMPFVIVFVICVTIPCAGYVPPPEFTSLPEATQDRMIYERAERDYRAYLANPDSPEGIEVRRWQGYYERPFRTYVLELKQKAELSAMR